MKKIFSLTAVAILAVCSTCVVACSPKYIERPKRSNSSPSKTSAYSYAFPYLTDSATSSQDKASRTFGNYSSEDVANIPSLSTGYGVANAINKLGEVTKENYLDLEQRIILIEEYYSALPMLEQLLVSNIDVLKEARRKFNDFLAQDNVSLKQNFVDKVNALPPFEHTAEFKAKLEEATDCYNLIHNNHKNEVENEYNALVALYEKTFDYDRAENFLNLYNNLPGYITNQTVGAYKMVIRNYNNLTNAQKAIVGEDVKSNVAKLAGEIALSYQTLYRTVFEQNINNDIFATNAKIGLSNTSCDYNGDKLTSGALCDRNSHIMIFAPYGGELTIYLSQSENLKLSLYQGSKKIQTTNVTANKIILYLDEIASYSINFSSETTVFAIEFN